MSVPLWSYLEIKKNAFGLIKTDKQCLRELRNTFNQIYGENNREDDELREQYVIKLIKQLGLFKDDFCVDCLNKCVSEATDAGAEMEIIAKINLHPEILNKIPTDEIQPNSQFPNATVSITNQVLEQSIVSIDQIICLIQQKSTKSEVKQFLKTFLFQQINQLSNKTIDESKLREPIFDGAKHRLAANCVLDSFIRREMIARGTITSPQARTKFRLIEPISLTDEFETWTFDHFHGLLDFWLIRDAENQQTFPELWKLNPNAQIEYIIVDGLTNSDENSSMKHIEYPCTESLDSFLRDICQMEDNGMFSTWYKALTTEENITKFGHLTNLNRKEWERISKLPMNALKTIKFYIDQDKLMNKQTKQQQQQGDDSSTDGLYSKAEIRANLHMVKLYLHRQLAHVQGMIAIPRLDSYSVETAFNEMRQEGYEDDGLFDQMKLFFQPLTVTNEELTINQTDLDRLDSAENKRKQKLEEDIESDKKSSDDLKSRMIELRKEISEHVEKQLENYRKNEIQLEKAENLSIYRKTQLNKAWLKADARLNTEIESKRKELIETDRQLQETDSRRINNENLLHIIKKNETSKPKSIDRRLVKPHRGFIMYGPPGTGKSVIMSQIARKIGIAMLGPPLAAGELERPLVGQSEAVILDLCMRGNRIPHLMCCVSIDEIDSLAPKRNQDPSEGKVAKISVLLSVIEGIKDVPNLMFFSATNRLYMMDEAFLRRMSGKFFVGRPSALARKRILDGVPKMILQPHIREKLATATTNFSGAALKSLTSAITVDYIAEKRLKQDYTMTEDKALILADRTARQYQLYLGIDTLPRLLLHNLDAQQQLLETKSKLPTQFHLPDPDKCQFTGKIIVSLQDKSVRIETIEKNSNQRNVIESPFIKTEGNLQQLLERLTSYGNDRNVQLIQLIDLNLLSSQGAYEEKKIFETLKERYDECMEYKRSMIIYDLDSLIGVSQNESESSMGTSVSSSIVNQHIYIYVTSRFREAKIELSRMNETMSIERWAVAVVRDSFLLKKFTADVDFMLTENQLKQDEDEHRRTTDVLLCVKCRESYIESENKMGACTYHDGFVYDNFDLSAKPCTPSDVILILNREESIAQKEPTKKDAIDRGKTRFKYICCHATVQIGGGSHGCKKDKHGYKTKKKDQSIYRTEEDLISEWETACLNSLRYNQRMKDLISKRNQQQS